MAPRKRTRRKNIYLSIQGDSGSAFWRGGKYKGRETSPPARKPDKKTEHLNTLITLVLLCVSGFEAMTGLYFTDAVAV